MKTSLLAQQKNAAKRTDSIDLLTPEAPEHYAHKSTFRMGEPTLEIATLENEIAQKLPAEPLLLAQANLVVSDAGTQTWLQASADTSESVNYSPPYLAEEKSGSFFSGSSYLMYGLAAVGVGAVVAVATKSKSKTSVETVTVTGTAVELATGGTKNASIVAGANVVVTDAATIAQLTQIDAKNGLGALNYTAITDTAANLSASTYVSAGKNVSVSNVANLAQLASIAAKNTGGTLNYTNISDSSANLLNDTASYLSKSGVTVTVTNALSLENFNVLKAQVSNGLTYSISDSTSNVLNELNGATSSTKLSNATAVTILGDSTTPIDVAQLLVLKGVNGNTTPIGCVVNDTAANLIANATVVSEATATTSVTPAITMTDSPSALTVANVNTLKGLKINSVDMTAGYGLSDSAANLLSGVTLSTGTLTGIVSSATSLTVNDASAPPLTILEVIALQNKGAIFTNGYIIQDTISNLNQAVGLTPTDAQTLAINNANSIASPTTTDNLSVAEVVNLLQRTTLTAASYTVSDTAENLLANPTAVQGASSITITGITPTLSLADAITLKSLNSGNGAVSGNYLISENSSELVPALLDGAKLAIISAASSVNLLDTPQLTVTDVLALRAANSNTSGYAVSDTGANIMQGLASDPAAISTASAVGGVAKAITISDIPTFTLDQADSLQTFVTNLKIDISNGYYLNDVAAELLQQTGTRGTWIGNASNIIVSDAPVLTIAQLSSILSKNTTVEISYSLSDSARNIWNNYYSGSATSTTKSYIDKASIVSGATVAVKANDLNSLLATLSVQELSDLKAINVSLGAHNVTDSAVNMAAALNNDSSILSSIQTATQLNASEISNTLTLSVTQMKNLINGSALLISNDTIVVDPSVFGDLGVLRAYGGNGTLTLSSSGNDQSVTVDLGTSAVKTVMLNGTGFHSVTGSNSTTVSETFVLNDASTNFSKIIGGTDISDVLRLTANHSTLNLGEFNVGTNPTLQGIEKVDLKTDTGSNTLTLTAADLFNLNSNLIVDGANGLIIDAGSNDVVSIGVGASAGQFALSGTQVIDTTTYNKYVATYTNGTDHLVEVLLQNVITPT
jgi:hypothetical protein